MTSYQFPNAENEEVISIPTPYDISIPPTGYHGRWCHPSEQCAQRPEAPGISSTICHEDPQARAERLTSPLYQPSALYGHPEALISSSPSLLQGIQGAQMMGWHIPSGSCSLLETNPPFNHPSPASFFSTAIPSNGLFPPFPTSSGPSPPLPAADLGQVHADPDLLVPFTLLNLGSYETLMNPTQHGFWQLPACQGSSTDPSSALQQSFTSSHQSSAEACFPEEVVAVPPFDATPIPADTPPAPADPWEIIRNKFVKLYVDDGHTLEQCMMVLKQVYDFNAS